MPIIDNLRKRQRNVISRTRTWPFTSILQSPNTLWALGAAAIRNHLNIPKFKECGKNIRKYCFPTKKNTEIVFFSKRFNLAEKEGEADRKVPLQPLVFVGKDGKVSRYNLRKVRN